jgi:hypothetical protein
MCAALPRSDYYEGSAPRSRHHRAWRLAGRFVPGARLEVLVFLEVTRDAVGDQLCPWQPWPSSIQDETNGAPATPAPQIKRE